jgi:hypothetical protein
MEVKIEEGVALKALRAHQVNIAEAKAQFAHVVSTSTAQRATLEKDRQAMPDLPALEKQESDALAAVALGEADTESAGRAQDDLAEAKVLASALAPKIAKAESTIAGLTRKAAEIRANIERLEAGRTDLLKAFLMEEIEQEAQRYVQAASTLIRSYSRMCALQNLIGTAAGEEPSSRIVSMGNLSGRFDLMIGRWPLPAFAGHQQSHLNDKVMFDTSDRLAPRGRTAGWAADEKARLQDELGIEFDSGSVAA